MRNPINGSEAAPHFIHDHGEFPLVALPNVLLPQGYDFRVGNNGRGADMMLTYFRGVLPSPDFSAQQFESLQAFAERGDEYEDQSFELARRTARALTRRTKAKNIEFDAQKGCWQLHLKAEYDTANRARYPHIAIPGITKNTSAHQLVYRYLLGLRIPTLITSEREAERRWPIDHLCHDHSCCNPYHLQVVSPGENTKRGKSVRNGKQHESLFAIEKSKDVVMPLSELLVYIGGRIETIQTLAMKALTEVAVSKDTCMTEDSRLVLDI